MNAGTNTTNATVMLLVRNLQHLTVASRSLSSAVLEAEPCDKIDGSNHNSRFMLDSEGGGGGNDRNGGNDGNGVDSSLSNHRSR
jgi:hypothetical protein